MLFPLVYTERTVGPLHSLNCMECFSCLPSTGPYSNLALLGLYNHIILASSFSRAPAPSRYVPGDLRSCSKLLTGRPKCDFYKPPSYFPALPFVLCFHGNQEAFREWPPFNKCVWNHPNFKRVHGWDRNSQASWNRESVYFMEKHIFSLRFQAPLPGTDSNTREHPVPCLLQSDFSTG